MFKTTSGNIDVWEAALEIVKPVDSKMGRMVRKALRNSRRDLLDLTIDPSAYQNPDRFKADYMAVSLLSKYDGFEGDLDLKEVALEKFRLAEKTCKATNRRLTTEYARSSPNLGYSASSLFEAARFKIARLLGDFCWNETFETMGFSSGASTRLTKRNGDPYYKMQGKPAVTLNALPLATAVMKASPVWLATLADQEDSSNWFTVVKGNNVTTVPKNAKSDRCIAIEPEMNMFIQRGVGAQIRKYMRRTGNDLNDQVRNQKLAYEASLHHKLATIDLSMASDSLSIELVRWLMPPDWFNALMLCRCASGEMPDGTHVAYEKISSMGNGFTFELESLIFWALAESVSDTIASDSRRVSVYGDDLIVETSAAGFLIELLSFAGFETNEDKTFLSGPFRESCGKHYFNGIDVTPIYIRSNPFSYVNATYVLANQLRRWCSYAGVCDPRYKEAYDRIVHSVRENLRRFIPDGIGDVGFIGSPEEYHQNISYGRDGKYSSQYRVKARLRLVGKVEAVDGVYGYLRALHGLPASSPWSKTPGTYMVTTSPIDLTSCREDTGLCKNARLREFAKDVRSQTPIQGVTVDLHRITNRTTLSHITQCNSAPIW